MTIKTSDQQTRPIISQYNINANNLKRQNSQQPDVSDRGQSLAGRRGRSNDACAVEGSHQALLVKFKIIRITAVACHADLICIIYANNMSM